MSAKLPNETLVAILETLPVNLNFIDENDIVRYRNKGVDRAEDASAGIGRKVQDCHPEASLPLLNEIISDLKSGKPERNYLRVNSKGRKKYFRVFPVKDAAGRYIGALEVVQDITDIQKM